MPKGEGVFMSNKQIKSIFYVLVIAVMSILLAVGCKKKTTQSSNFQIVEEPGSTTETPQPTPPENPMEPVLPIDNETTMKQFDGLYFESKEYVGGLKFTAKVGLGDSGYQKGAPYIQFEDGYKFYQGFKIDSKYNGNYNLLYGGEIGDRDGYDIVKAKATFDTNGYLYVKFENYNWTIEYALTEETNN